MKPAKTTTNSLEIQSLVPRDLHVSIGLINRLVHKKYLESILNRVQNSTFWVLITPPNRHIASPVAMSEIINKQRTKTCEVKKVCKSNA